MLFHETSRQSIHEPHSTPSLILKEIDIRTLKYHIVWHQVTLMLLTPVLIY